MAAATSRTPRKRAEFVVDLERERIVVLERLSVAFRPGQSIADPYVIALCRENGIPLRPKGARA